MSPPLHLISDLLPFGGLWYLQITDAISYTKHNSRAHDAMISVYDAAGKLVEVHRHKSDFKEPRMPLSSRRLFPDKFL